MSLAWRHREGQSQAYRTAIFVVLSVLSPWCHYLKLTGMVIRMGAAFATRRPALQRVRALKANTNLRAGVIGAGAFGRLHAQKYASLPGVELIGVADANLERAREISGSLGA